MYGRARKRRERLRLVEGLRHAHDPIDHDRRNFSTSAKGSRIIEKRLKTSIETDDIKDKGRHERGRNSPQC
jgi:hypothetical protein